LFSKHTKFSTRKVYKILTNDTSGLQIELIGFVNLWAILEATEREPKLAKNGFYPVEPKQKTILRTAATTLKRKHQKKIRLVKKLTT